MKRFSVALVCVLSLSGFTFAAKQPKPPKGNAAAKPPADAAAHAVGAPVNAKTYIIGAEDVLAIKVWNEAQITNNYNVRPDGKISLPLISEIQAAGLTPEQLAASITEGLSKYMTRPEVSVAVLAINSKKYFIMGEVQKTGSFPLLIPTTVLEALVNAGGFHDFAKKGKIVIIRGTQRLPFNYNDVIKGKRREENILLEPGDQIIVP